jgi:zinc protease
MPLDALRKRLAGTVVRVGASIGGESEGITASGSPRDLELLFTLMYLQFTAPRLDTVAFKAYKTSLREQLANRASDPAARFQDTLVAALTQGHPRTRPMTLAAVDSIDADWALRFFRDRFADASDFTFFIVGAFNPDSIRPAVERYIGGLPSTGRKEKPRDVGIRPPRGIVRKTVAAGTEPRSSTRLVFTGEAPITLESRSHLDALIRVFQRRLTERLREQLGGTYSPGVSAGVSRFPVPRYEVSVSFGSAPERVDDLVAATLEIMRDLRERGPTANEVHDAAEAQRRQRETALRENGYWLNMLVLHDDEGWDFASIAQPEPPGGGRALSAAVIQDAARRYLGASNYVQVTLVPATTTP